MKESGQIVLILLLVITVALGIGLAVVSRSITDVSTATRVEESARAFSAAEAGIEKALFGDYSGVVAPSGGASANVFPLEDLPKAREALEYPPLKQEDVAQIWLEDPQGEVSKNYTQSTIDVFWGLQGISNPTDRAAVAITVVYREGVDYKSAKFFFDPNPIVRAGSGGFNQGRSPSCSDSLPTITTSMGVSRKFYCRVNLDLPQNSILMRARLLYNIIPQPLALNPLNSGSIPPQASIFTSIGTSGQVQRKVQVFKLDKVVPPYFDYAIFSAGEITK